MGDLHGNQHVKETRLSLKLSPQSMAMENTVWILKKILNYLATCGSCMLLLSHSCCLHWRNSRTVTVGYTTARCAFVIILCLNWHLFWKNALTLLKPELLWVFSLHAAAKSVFFKGGHVEPDRAAPQAQLENFHIRWNFIIHNANKLHLKVVAMLIYSLRLLWGVFSLCLHGYFTICHLGTFRSDSYLYCVSLLSFILAFYALFLSYRIINLVSSQSFDC